MHQLSAEFLEHNKLGAMLYLIHSLTLFNVSVELRESPKLRRKLSHQETF